MTKLTSRKQHQLRLCPYRGQTGVPERRIQAHQGCQRGSPGRPQSVFHKGYLQQRTCPIRCEVNRPKVFYKLRASANTESMVVLRQRLGGWIAPDFPSVTSWDRLEGTIFLVFLGCFALMGSDLRMVSYINKHYLRYRASQARLWRVL